MKVTYDLENVYLIPKYSEVESRDDVDLSQNIGLRNFRVPIIASPMKGIISPSLVYEMAEWGGIGILHRFYEDHSDLMRDVDTVQMMLKQANLDERHFGISVGTSSLDDAIRLIDKVNPAILCVDVANGYLSSLLDFCERVAEYIINHDYDIQLMSGNVVTAEGVIRLANRGVNLIRVGIGTGSLCTTRKVTGVGYGYLNSIIECSSAFDGVYIVADGGIKNPGDAIKLLAAGADFVMMGSIFAEVYESAHNGIIYGMASRKLQEEYYHAAKSVEGIEKEVQKRRSFKEFASEFEYGMRSAMTYLGAFTLNQLISKAEFVYIK